MTRSEFLETARKIVTEDRNKQYKEPEDNFGIIADYWSVYLGIPITAMDVGVMMNLFKTARITNNPTIDSFVDSIGYMACAGEIYCKQTSGDLNDDKTDEVESDSHVPCV